RTSLIMVCLQFSLSILSNAPGSARTILSDPLLTNLTRRRSLVVVESARPRSRCTGIDMESWLARHRNSGNDLRKPRRAPAYEAHPLARHHRPGAGLLLVAAPRRVAVGGNEGLKSPRQRYILGHAALDIHAKYIDHP